MTNKIAQRNFSDLSFDGIRSKIVEYLKTKTEFEDFDFEGPGISLLIDALAYTQTYMAQHANMAVAETFLQSARIRHNVVAKAKELGYLPKSRNAASAIIHIEYSEPDSEDVRNDLSVPRGTSFSSNGGNGKTFSLLEDANLTHDRTEDGNHIYSAEPEVFEGTIRRFSVELNGEGPTERINIPSRDIDTKHLRIYTETEEALTEFWTEVDNVTNVDKDSKVYFIQENPSGHFEIYFGDDQIGANPGSGAIINIDYFVTSGEEGNGSNTFEINNVSEFNNQSGTSATSSAFDIRTIEPSRNGSDKESIESIRHAAPLIYQTQNRAVTEADYSAILQSEFGFIDTMNVWGGENNDPPFYGRVFIAIKPKVGEFLTPITKQEIERTLQEDYSIMAITPRVVDPEYLYVIPTSAVTFNPESTSRNTGQLRGDIRRNVDDFFQSNSRFFDYRMRHSRLVETIDSTNDAILGNLTSIQLKRQFQPTPNRLIEYEMKFFNALQPGTINSKKFQLGTREIQFKDDRNGNISMFVNGKLSRVKVGTVDYETGKVVLNRFVYRTSNNFTAEFFAIPEKLDVETSQNALIRFDSQSYNIDLVERE